MHQRRHVLFLVGNFDARYFRSLIVRSTAQGQTVLEEPRWGRGHLATGRLEVHTLPLGPVLLRTRQVSATGLELDAASARLGFHVRFTPGVEAAGIQYFALQSAALRVIRTDRIQFAQVAGDR